MRFIQDAKNQLHHVPHLLHPHQWLRHIGKTNIWTGAVKDLDLSNLPAALTQPNYKNTLQHTVTKRYTLTWRKPPAYVLDQHWGNICGTLSSSPRRKRNIPGG